MQLSIYKNALSLCTNVTSLCEKLTSLFKIVCFYVEITLPRPLANAVYFRRWARLFFRV